MIIALILTAMVCGLVSSISLMGGALAYCELPSFRRWGNGLVSFVELLILRPGFAAVGVRTNRWATPGKVKVCLLLGVVTLAAMLLLFKLIAHLNG